MHVSVVGVNHQTAPVAVREKAAISAEQLYQSRSGLRHYISRGIILSTCNRTEVYATDSDHRQAEAASLNFLKVHLGIPDADLPRYVYVYKDEAAVEHLFRVASGLDSMIIGEFEVLGQVGQALEIAEKARMVNLPLRSLFQSAVRTGRRVREETGISQNALSVSSVAVDLAASIVGDLRSGKMLIIGAGEAGRLVAKAARDRGASRLVVASRTKERAVPLAAALGGVPASLKNLVAEMSTCSIVVTCASAPRRILDFRQVAAAMKSRPELPLVIIDIAVPRNVEPAVRQIDNVFLYDIDDLTEISALNRQQREGEMQEVVEIIAAERDKFVTWWRALEVRPVVSALMKKAEEVRRAQLNQTLKKLPRLSAEERDSLEAMTKSIVTKILRNPVQYLKANVDGDRDYAEIVSELFQLNREKPG